MLKSLFWIGATGIALIAGIALHHGDDIQRGGEKIAAQAVHFENFEEIGSQFEREFDEAEAEVEAGADREASYEDALASAFVSSGIFTLDNIDDISRNDGVRRLEIDNGDRVQVEVEDVIDLAKAKLLEAEAAGQLPEGRGIDGDDIDDVLEVLEDLEAIQADTSINL